MKKGGSEVNPQSVAEDIRRGLSDDQLMEKHGLSSDGLAQLLERLLIKNYLTRHELEERSFLRLTEDDFEALAEDLHSDLFYQELREEYGLSDDELRKSFHWLREKGLAREEEINSAVRAVNPREVVKDIVENASDENIRQKYGLSPDELGKLFDMLIARSFLSADELGDRYVVKRPRREMVSLAADLKRGLFHEELKEKYGLSHEDLGQSFQSLVEQGLATREEIAGKVAAVNAGEAVQDFLSEASNESLGEKYGLSPEELFQLFHHLVARSFLSPSDLKHRYPASLSEEDLEDLAADLAKGAFHEELREEYGLSDDELHKCLNLLVARGMAPGNATNSPVKAVNPSEVVPDIQAAMPEEDLRKKYGLSRQELFQLFESLTAGSFMPPGEIEELYGAALTTEKPPMVKVFETNNFMELGLAKAVLQDEGIPFEEFHPERRRSLHSAPPPVQIVVEESEAEKARGLIAELQEATPPPEEEPNPPETRTSAGERRSEVGKPADPAAVVPPQDRDVNELDESLEEDPPSGPALWIQLLGLVVLLLALCYLLGVFEL